MGYLGALVQTGHGSLIDDMCFTLCSEDVAGQLLWGAWRTITQLLWLETLRF